MSEPTELAIVLHPDGTYERVRFSKEDTSPIARAIPGHLEMIRLRIGTEVFVNGYLDEEGKLKPLPINAMASSLWEVTYGPTDILHGPVILFGGDIESGDEQGLSFQESMALALCLHIFGAEERVTDASS